MNALIFVMVLCTNSGKYGQACLMREYKTLEQCKSFVASAEALTADKSQMASMKGVCIAEEKK